MWGGLSSRGSKSRESKIFLAKCELFLIDVRVLFNFVDAAPFSIRAFESPFEFNLYRIKPFESWIHQHGCLQRL